MKRIYRKSVSLLLVFSLLLSLITPASAAGKNPYTAGNPEGIVISIKQLDASVHQLSIYNGRDAAIGSWKLSFKTNFGLSNPVGVAWTVSKNNTYSFWDASDGHIASGESFSFTVESNKKKNCAIHNVVFDFKDIENANTCNVSFDYNCKEFPRVHTTQVSSGQTIMPPEDPQREGYLFVGWYTDKDSPLSKKPYDFAENPITSDTTFYALWFKEKEQLSDGEIDNFYLEYAIIPNLLLRGMDISDIRLSDDYDGDGLTLIEEYELDTSPFSEDFDEDGLSDYDEVKVYGSDPLKKDTDGDGLSDGKEILFGGDPLTFETGFSVTSGYDKQNGINASVSLSLSGSQAESLEIKKLTDYFLLPSDMPGYIDDAYSFTVDGTFDEAIISFRFDENLLTDTGFNPVIYYFNEALQQLEEMPTELDGNTASTRVKHFSTYILLNKTAYEEAFEWIEIQPFNASNKFNIVLLIDVSDSMNQNDPEYERLSAARNLIDDLPQGSLVSIVSFGTSSIVQGGTEDKELLKSVLTKEYFASIESRELYYDVETARALLDDQSPEFNKALVVFTDGERDDISTDLSILSQIKSREVRVFTVGFGICDNRVITDYFKPLSESSGGGFYPMADDMSAMHQHILGDGNIEADSDGDGILDYYEDYITLFNGTKMQLDKHNPDTDGDGLLDGEELELDIQPIALGDDGATRVRVIGKMYSNPAAVDTDFDGLSDLVDAYPLDFDCKITIITDDSIYFNTGRIWCIIQYSAYDIMDNLLSTYPENPIPIEEIRRSWSNISYNKTQKFSDEELAAIGLLNNEGSKLYMHYNLSASERENIFHMLTGRECKCYQHTGFSWWTEWKEVPHGTQGGFFKGTVITEADLNFSMNPFLLIDYVDVLNLAVVYGAYVFVIYHFTLFAFSEFIALFWYIEAFGIINGLRSYSVMGSQYYYGQTVDSLENGVASVVEADAADGKLDTIDVLFSNGNAVSDISNGNFRHIYNEHTIPALSKQMEHLSDDAILAKLEKTFFNPGWTDNQVRAAATYAYNQALANGIVNGTYSVQYLGEEVVVALQNGLFQTAYGVYHYTLEELLELLGR